MPQGRQAPHEALEENAPSEMTTTTLHLGSWLPPAWLASPLSQLSRADPLHCHLPGSEGKRSGLSHRNCEALRGSQFHGGHGLLQPTMVQRGQGTGRCSTYPLPEFFYAIYHKRSNVESTNSSPKRLFPAELRSEELRRQRGPVQGDSLQSGSFREGNEDVWDQARLPCGGLVARRGGPWVVRSARAESCAGGLVPWESSCRICSNGSNFRFLAEAVSPMA